jgi:molybdopterin converting factor small subunit
VARVVFSSGQRRLVGGAESLEVDAGDVRALLAALDAKFPGFAAQIGEANAIAIDGEIIPHGEALFERLRPDSEVHFLPKIGGG